DIPMKYSDNPTKLGDCIIFVQLCLEMIHQSQESAKTKDSNYGSDVVQYPTISNFSYDPQIISESTSPDSSNPQLFYTTSLMG
ncbi:15916_t:CDS:2, partial [Acaulospora morrowiae]